MLKKIGVIVLMLVFETTLFAQNVSLDKHENTHAKTEIKIESTAALKFETEEHNFGNLVEGPEVKYDFIFSNTGKAPLILADVHASCGCTTPVWPREPILPGSKSKITVVYNTKNRPGTFNKAITIKSNAKGLDKVLTIKGVVLKADENIVPKKAINIINEIPN
jgi:hypothetical protein